MRKILTITGLFWLLAAAAQAAHTEAQLLLAAEQARPGDTVLAGVKLTMEPGWHTYWKNPGSAGQATSIKWTLPPGVTAGEIQWPLPKKDVVSDIITFDYEHEVVLLVPLTLDKNIAPGTVNIGAKISWLECNESCIPAGTDAEAGLEIGAEAKNSSEAALLAEWSAKVPTSDKKFAAHAFWQEPATNSPRELRFEVDWITPAATMHRTVDFYPAASEDFEIQAATKKILDATGKLAFTKPVKKFAGEWPQKISGVLVVDDAAYETEFPVTDPTPPGSPATAAGKVAERAAGPPPSLLKMLLFAFIGGLILNIMPCVLPVIALKILGFVNEAKSEPGRVRKLGFIYTLGVLVSFLALAAIVVGVKAAGHQAGWGMQFGNPVFLVCLTTLVTLVALNLFGVFEFVLGGGVMDTASNLSSKHGAAGAFFNGVLATVLATPCTAPFLSIALGFAFAQSAAVIVVIFLTVGLGLASPYVLLSWNPAWLKFLPKPGAWMEKFKIAMGFPMLATAVWLVNIASSSYGKKVLWLGVFLVVVAFAAWVFGEFVQRGRSRKTVAGIVALLLLAGGYLFALEKELHWRAPILETAANGSLKESADGIDWQRWSPEAVAAARAAGKIVLVDFTADWCLTCQLNKKTSLEITAVREKIKSLGAVALLGDNTLFPPSILTELEHFNRAGVPLVLVYPKKPEASAIVLPEILTPGLVLDALDRAAQ